MFIGTWAIKFYFNCLDFNCQLAAEGVVYFINFLFQASLIEVDSRNSFAYFDTLCFSIFW